MNFDPDGLTWTNYLDAIRTNLAGWLAPDSIAGHLGLTLGVLTLALIVAGYASLGGADEDGPILTEAERNR